MGCNSILRFDRTYYVRLFCNSRIKARKRPPTYPLSEVFTKCRSASMGSNRRWIEESKPVGTFDLEQAACFLNVSPSTAQEMAASGELPGAKIGRAWVFLEEDLVDWLREQIKFQREQRQSKNYNLSKPPSSSKAPISRKNRRRKPPKLPELPSQIGST